MISASQTRLRMPCPPHLADGVHGAPPCSQVHNALLGPLRVYCWIIYTQHTLPACAPRNVHVFPAPAHLADGARRGPPDGEVHDVLLGLLALVLVLRELRLVAKRGAVGHEGLDDLCAALQGGSQGGWVIERVTRSGTGRVAGWVRSTCDYRGRGEV